LGGYSVVGQRRNGKEETLTVGGVIGIINAKRRVRTHTAEGRVLALREKEEKEEKRGRGKVCLLKCRYCRATVTLLSAKFSSFSINDNPCPPGRAPFQTVETV